jgi:hypothetical protein
MSLQPRTVALLRNLIGLAAIVLIFYFLGGALVSNWSDLSSEDIDVRPALLVLSGIPATLGVALLAIAWGVLLGDLGVETNRLSRAELPKVFLYSWVGRYVPGKVAYVVGRFVLGRSIGVAAAPLIASMAYEGVLLIVAGAAFSTVLLVPALAVVSESVLPYLALPALALAGAVGLHPRVLGWALGVGLRVLGREQPSHEWLLSPTRMARIGTLYLLSFCVSSAGFYLLIISLTSYSPGHLPLAAGAFTLASVLGVISVFAPAGIGVREGVLVAVLQTSMPVELAVVISLAARVWATVIDLLLVGGCFAYDFISGERLLFAALRGRAAEPEGAPDAAEG